MRKIIISLLLSFVFILGCKYSTYPDPEISNFEDCMKAGYPIMESYPRQCRIDDQTFTEQIKISIEEAIDIAQNSECTEQGTLTDNYMYNENSRTWWIDLDLEKQGCNPACVVKEDKTAEINWRCTGLLP